MSHFENKGLILGIMAGTAGISLVLVWYHKTRKPSAAMNMPAFTDVGNKLNSVGLEHEAHNEQGAVMVLHGRQLQILEKLNGLLISVDELKREVKFLKEAIPKLEDLVREGMHRERAHHTEQQGGGKRRQHLVQQKLPALRRQKVKEGELVTFSFCCSSYAVQMASLCK